MINGIIQTTNLNDTPWVYGEPLVTFGLENRGTVNGLGLVTRGLAWQLYDIWFDLEYYVSISTAWTASESTITTTWNDCQFGVFGDYRT